MGTLPAGLEKNVLDLYLFYLELSFLLGLPTMSKAGAVTANLKDVTTNVRAILLAGVPDRLGNVKKGINDTLASVEGPADANHLTTVLNYFQKKRIEEEEQEKQDQEETSGENQVAPASSTAKDKPVIKFEGMLELVEACQHSSDRYPTLLDKLFSEAGYIAKELAKGEELAAQRAKAAAERARTGERQTQGEMKKEREDEERYACTRFIAALFANPDIQQAMRRCCNMRGLLGHLYRSHLFYLPPAVPDCDPFPDQQPMTLAQVVAVQEDIDEHSLAHSAGFTSGSKCRVMPDFSFKLKDGKSVKNHLQTLAAAHQNREIYYLGWRAANWRVSAYHLNCMRVAAAHVAKKKNVSVPQAFEDARGEDIMNILKKAGGRLSFFWEVWETV
ncbi:MAG: hypothetical protein RBG13Loki_0964 [Promethearchaeota archaeon CR_4]|nr:MAG: hypothetical protein RBG13Loki_0964 [Candidatus Lokiarchaeota archaeon CR_4]